MIRNHHENFDGSGYPDRLKGEEIPLGARIIAVSDVFDAMTSLRPHRKAMHPEEALIEMERGMGKQFDPHLMDIFIKGKIYNLTV
jgi:putative two-component system response regulator